MHGIKTVGCGWGAVACGGGEGLREQEETKQRPEGWGEGCPGRGTGGIKPEGDRERGGYSQLLIVCLWLKPSRWGGGEDDGVGPCWAAPPAPPCSGCSSCLAHPLRTGAQELCGDTRRKGTIMGGSHTCSLGHYHLGFAAGTIAFHGVGGYSDGVGGLRLQVCDDHLLQVGVGSAMQPGLRPALPTLLPGLGSSKVDVGPGPQAETCTRAHAQTLAGSTYMLRWAHAA